MKRKSVTSRDVAKLAGVSQSAVSRCFSQHASVSEATRKKILVAARTLGYRPNTIARSLITRSSRTIAIVTSSLENPFYSVALERSSHLFQAQGYHLLLFTVPDDGECGEVIDDIIRSQVEGVLMLSVTLDSAMAREFVDSGIPVVVINRTVSFDGISQVGCDNYHGGYWAGSFLAMAGHERIAFMAGVEESSTSRLRYEGFIDGLGAFGRQCHAVVCGNYRFEEARHAALGLFSCAPIPDALFAANDQMAIAVMDTLRHELGLAVPLDVSVVGFDDMPIAAWPSYQLTTVRQPLEAMIEEAVDLLLEQMRDERRVPRQITLPVVPILRASARRPVRDQAAV